MLRDDVLGPDIESSCTGGTFWSIGGSERRLFWIEIEGVMTEMGVLEDTSASVMAECHDSGLVSKLDASSVSEEIHLVHALWKFLGQGRWEKRDGTQGGKEGAAVHGLGESNDRAEFHKRSHRWRGAGMTRYVRVARR